MRFPKVRHLLVARKLAICCAQVLTFTRLTCFHFVLNPHILDTAGNTETYFDSTNLEKRRWGRMGLQEEKTDQEGGVNS